jgi:hypothetical protein
VTKQECDYVIYDQPGDIIFALIKKRGRKYVYFPTRLQESPIEVDVDTLDDLITVLPELLDSQ